MAQIKTRARQDGNNYVLDGSKVFSTNAGTPLHGVTTVVAVTDPEKGSKGLSTFAVPVGTSGFSIGKPGRKIGWRNSPVANQSSTWPRRSVVVSRTHWPRFCTQRGVGRL